MAVPEETGKRAAKIADVLRPLGRGLLPKKQAVLAAGLLCVHWTTVYLLRRRFLANPVASAVAPQRRGPSTGGRRLGGAVDTVIDEVVGVWLPTQRQLAHPATDLVLEVRADVRSPDCNRLAERPLDGGGRSIVRRTL